MRFSALLVVFTAILIGVSCCFYAYLNLSKLNSDLNRIEAERYQVVAGSIADNAEQGLRFGLLIRQIVNIEPALQRVKTRHPEISAAAIIRDDCSPIFGDRQKLPDKAVLCQMKAQSGLHDIGGLRYIFRNISDSFDTVVGSVVVAYPDNQQSAAVSTAMVELIESAVIVLLVVGSISLVGVMVLTRWTAKTFSRLAKVLEGTVGLDTAALPAELNARLSEREDAIRRITDSLSWLEGSKQEGLAAHD